MARDRGHGGIRSVRSVFISDLHLGCRHAQPAAFLEFLQSIDPQSVYLVGDFIDGWRLRSRWWWDPVYLEIFRTLAKLGRRGVDLFYTPGNHDDFLRIPSLPALISDTGLLQVADEFVHETADARQFLVTHGDLFDKVERKAKWLSLLGTCGYNLLLTADRVWHVLRRRSGRCSYPLSAAVKSRVKRAVAHVGGFEEHLVEHARSQDCVGVICGHIHTPQIAVRDGLTYCNTGDWVEHCTALVEDMEGRLRLLVRHDDGDMRLMAIEGHAPLTQEDESLAAASPKRS